MAVHTVIAAYDDYGAVNDSRLVYQQMDTRILIELSGIGIATKVLMVAQTSIDRRRESVKLLCHAFFV